MKVVVGVDSGGSKSRALAVSLSGDLVGTAEAGGGHPEHNPEFEQNIRSAILESMGDTPVTDVVAIVAGISGLDRPQDHEWAERTTRIHGCTAERLQVNDAEIVHFGALEGRPGIVSIQGNGSAVHGRNERGQVVRNAEFFHYASSSAPQVGIRAAYALMTEACGPEDEEFQREILRHWGVESASALRQLALRDWRPKGSETFKTAGGSAPIVTRWAMNGSRAALAVCERCGSEIALGIKLVGPHFEAEEIDVVLIGSCGTSEAISTVVKNRLEQPGPKRYRLVQPKTTPVQGAALWALSLAGVAIDEPLKARIRALTWPSA